MGLGGVPGLVMGLQGRFLGDGRWATDAFEKATFGSAPEGRKMMGGLVVVTRGNNLLKIKGG
jgi:hypothetical protein